jgi:hypothetical protein
MLARRLFALLCLGSAVLLAPGAARADARALHDDIRITRNGEFTKDNGVVSGRGTPRDPFVISGWDVHTIEIKDTSKAFRIENNSIHSQLVLNWVGRNVVVRGNDIGDLRVNENIPRHGAPTSGVIEKNTFGFVGQLRHFDGMFVHNTVGYPRNNFSWPWDSQAVNFDGFNGAHFAYNTIYGYVDARLHGHHHSSGFAEGSHMHAGEDHEMVDHTKRWHEVFIHDNHIVTANYYALSYLDTNHAGNDRTAASETNPDLKAPHIHRTRVHIMDNVLEGGGMLIDVFNARDELHTRLGRGAVHVTGNRITLAKGPFYPFDIRHGIEVWQARALDLHIADNTIEAPVRSGGLFAPRAAGIFLNVLDRATVEIMDNAVTNQYYGVQASQLTERVHWMVHGLRTHNVGEDVSYDDSVQNAPERG